MQLPANLLDSTFDVAVPGAGFSATMVAAPGAGFRLRVWMVRFGGIQALMGANIWAVRWIRGAGGDDFAAMQGDQTSTLYQYFPGGLLMPENTAVVVNGSTSIAGPIFCSAGVLYTREQV